MFPLWTAPISSLIHRRILRTTHPRRQRADRKKESEGSIFRVESDVHLEPRGERFVTVQGSQQPPAPTTRQVLRSNNTLVFILYRRSVPLETIHRPPPPPQSRLPPADNRAFFSIDFLWITVACSPTPPPPPRNLLRESPLVRSARVKALLFCSVNRSFVARETGKNVFVVCGFDSSHHRSPPTFRSNNRFHSYLRSFVSYDYK